MVATVGSAVWGLGVVGDGGTIGAGSGSGGSPMHNDRVRQTKVLGFHRQPGVTGAIPATRSGLNLALARLRHPICKYLIFFYFQSRAGTTKCAGTGCHCTRLGRLSEKT